MLMIKNISLTNQEWIMIFAVFVALIVFFAAVICIVYTLVRGVRLEEERQEAQAIQAVKEATSKVCKHPKVKADKVVVEIEAEATGTTQTQSSFTNISLDARSPITSSPEIDTAVTLPVETHSSTLSVEFEKEFKAAMENERKLVEECLMQKFRQEMEKREPEKRKVTFVEEPEILPESPETLQESSEALTPPKQPSPIAEPKKPSPIAESKQPSPFVKPMTPSLFNKPTTPSLFDKPMTPSLFAKPTTPSLFAKPMDQSAFTKPLTRSLFSRPVAQSSALVTSTQSSSVVITPPQQLKSTKKTLDRSQLPPLKSFTPPRALTPHFTFDSKPLPAERAILLKKPMDSRKTFKRPNSSIYE